MANLRLRPNLPEAKELQSCGSRPSANMELALWGDQAIFPFLATEILWNSVTMHPI